MHNAYFIASPITCCMYFEKPLYCIKQSGVGYSVVGRVLL